MSSTPLEEQFLAGLFFIYIYIYDVDFHDILILRRFIRLKKTKTHKGVEFLQQK